MITPFQIYLIMQLDSLNGVAIFLSILSGVACLVGCIMYIVNIDLAPKYDDNKAYYETGHKLMRVARWPFVIALAAATLLPSSKTMAAMIILPAIVNNEKVQQEAGELYKIAKEGLRELVTDEDEVKIELKKDQP